MISDFDVHKIPNKLVANLVAFKLIGCKLPSGVALFDASDVAEFTDDNDDSTSETGATPNDESISSKSLLKMSRKNKYVSIKPFYCPPILYYNKKNQRRQLKHPHNIYRRVSLS